MALFLDSAIREEAKRAAAMGFVNGVTTNPALIARAGRPAIEVIGYLLDMAEWPVFYQVISQTRHEIEDEARKFTSLAPDRVVLKVMCELPLLEIMADMGAGYRWAATGVFTGAQAFLACEAGAGFLIPYVNRATRYGGDGVDVVDEIATILDACGSETEIVAASIKSAREAVGVLIAGAHHVSVPLSVIEEMASHPLTTIASEEFRRVSKAQE